MFSRKKDTKVIVKEQQRQLKKDGRGLEREEKKLKKEMQNAAKKGNNEEVKALAKSMVKLRQAKDRLRGAASQNKSMGYQLTSVVTNEKLMNSMKGTAKVTAKVNKLMKPEKT